MAFTGLTTEEQCALKEDILRWKAPFMRRRLLEGRWRLIWAKWLAGESPTQIAAFIGRSPSTVTTLLKRAFKWHSEQPGFVWPTQEGKRVCDVPHPYTIRNEDAPSNWVHRRAIVCAASSRIKNRHFYCPVCRSSYWEGMTLANVFDLQRLDDPAVPVSEPDNNPF